MKRLIAIALLCVAACGACSKDPSSFDERVAAAEAHLGLGDPEGALSAYRSIAKHFAGDERCAGIFVRIGDLESTVLRDPAKAIQAYGKAIDAAPLSAAAQAARERRAALRAERGDHEGAIEDYAGLLKYYPNDPNRYRYRVLLAGVYLTARNYRQARVELKPLVEAKDTPAEAREQAIFIAAESFFVEGKTERAIEYYDWFLRDFPKSELASEVKLHLATCFEEMGQLGAARELTKGASKEYPNRGVIDARLKSLDDRGKNPQNTRKEKAGAPQQAR
jgi:tetratricopeptide (TPR) repeat protein